MKKLISLVTLVAVIASFSLCAFADTDVSDKITGDETLLTANGDGVYTVEAESTGDYATILAVKGKTIKVGAIQYINQDVTTEGKATFEFALNDDILGNDTSKEIDDDVYVLTGGDSNGIKVAGKIALKPEESNGYTVSGAVTNYVEQAFFDEALIPCVEEIFLGEGLDEYIAAYTATAYLVDLETIEEFIGYYVGDADEFSYIAKADVSAVDGSYSFSEVADGTYALVITRPGALPYMDYLTVDGANVTVDSVALINGDYVGAKDYLIDNGDLGLLLDSIGQIGEDNFVASYDVAADCLLDNGDLGELLVNIGDITTYNTELILELFS